MISPPNILVMAVGHSGSTVFARFLGALGWITHASTDPWEECPAVRAVNDQLLAQQSARPAEALASLRAPWAVKDPRFTLTLHHWHDAASDAVLIWLRRAPEAVRASYRRRNELVPGGEPGMYGRTVADLEYSAAHQYEAWPGPKLALAHEQLQEAAGLYQR